MSVLGETVLVSYGDNTLVAYLSDSPTPDQVLQTPEGLRYMSSITTDGHSSFLMTDSKTGVYVLVRKGNLRHRIEPDTSTDHTDGLGLQDCAVVQSQLWLGLRLRSIAVMSSQ